MVGTLLLPRRDRLVEGLLTMNSVSHLKSGRIFSAVLLYCRNLLRLNIHVVTSNADGAKVTKSASSPMIASGDKLIAASSAVSAN
jgi:hypothetical protein